jgi:beta-glucosidase/6-phospho-beta-glucosidase/beta-galactosidase
MLFRSFILAGFECATGYNARGDWIDLVAATHHDLHADADYARLREVGIHAAREAVRWPLVDKGGGRYDFTTLEPFLAAAQKHEIEVIWDLFHYGYPAHLDPFSAEFPHRFADYCHAAAQFISSQQTGPGYYTPVNEPSFFAWAAGDTGRFAPHATGRGPELKRALAAAAIQGINAIRAAAPAARIVNVDPLCHVAAPPGRPDLAETIRHFNEHVVWESWDMIAGRLHPELGGSRAHLDIVGVNYYWTNQWEWGRPTPPLAPDDARRVSLRALLQQVWRRYGGEVLLTETAHVDDMRPSWMNYVTSEATALLDEGFPLRGICLYPILGMTEWHEPGTWVRMGLWDLHPRGSPTLEREICAPLLEAMRMTQKLEARFKGTA